MALIKCPECQKEVSDKAINCPNCAYTINKPKIDNSIKIKLNSKVHGPIRIYDMNTSVELWTGNPGQVASINISKPTRIGVAYGMFGGSNIKNVKDKWQTIAEPGKKYSFEYSEGGIFEMPRINLVEVDTIIN